ncbi:MAG: hypothetical protein EOO38_04290 [Cytophagaceae bacterium]|nr:MAG: hypothetical protein EOO38_04290 [Cytophagaceae bacterium]
MSRLAPIINYQAQHQVVRLTRIWNCERSTAYSHSDLQGGCIRLPGDVSINLQWDGDDVVAVILSWGEMRLWCHWDGQIRCLRRFRIQEPTGPFAERWLEFFRRGCYLSGIAIECSEHERLEWVKWLESWDLVLVR